MEYYLLFSLNFFLFIKSNFYYNTIMFGKLKSDTIILCVRQVCSKKGFLKMNRTRGFRGR